MWGGVTACLFLQYFLTFYIKSDTVYVYVTANLISCLAKFRI